MNKEIVIMDYVSGTVSFHTAPQSVKTSADLEDYVRLTLEVDNDCEYMIVDKINTVDFRNENQITK